MKETDLEKSEQSEDIDTSEKSNDSEKESESSSSSGPEEAHKDLEQGNTYSCLCICSVNPELCARGVIFMIVFSCIMGIIPLT